MLPGHFNHFYCGRIILLILLDAYLFDIITVVPLTQLILIDGKDFIAIRVISQSYLNDTEGCFGWFYAAEQM